MNIENYRSQIIKIREKLGAEHIDKTRANFLWSVYKDIPDLVFNHAIESYLLDQSQTLETHIDKAIDQEKEDEKEEIKQTYIKPKFEIPTTAKPKQYCCDYGYIFARKPDTGALYVFKCTCMLSKYVSSRYETWSNTTEFERVS